MIACTIIARNYLAPARVLARSFLAHHPGGRLEVLVLDDDDHAIGDEGEPFTVVRPGELGLGPDYRVMATIYEVIELATAVKPFLLAALVRRHAAPVTYLDPDIQVFAPLDDCADLAARHGIVLTPHLLAPIPRDGKYPAEVDILKAGSFNLGFVSVGPGAMEFLDWWGERLRRDCLHAVDQGLFLDQRWVDLAVHYFGHHVQRDETLNVAYWNLDARPLTWDGSRYLVNGRPLRFFHFSGYQPGQTDLLVKYVIGEARVRITDNPALERICGGYSELLAAEGHAASRRVPYGYATSTAGVALTPVVRRSYRQAVLAPAGPTPPDPFDPAQAAAFTRWADSLAPPPAPSSPPSTLASRLPAPVKRVLRPVRRRLIRPLGRRVRRLASRHP